MIINDTIKLGTLQVPNLPTGGNIGTAVNTVDQFSMFCIAQTTENQIITLSTPTITNDTYLFYIKNTGTTSFYIYSKKVNVGDIANIIYQNGTFSTYSNEAVGNIINQVNIVPPTTVMNISNLYEISMPANTDVRIRSISGATRLAYITSHGEYSGGSFSTTSNLPVSVTTTPIPADNNIHVAGEMNVIKIQDIQTKRIFIVTVWRLEGIAGVWTGWVEEIGFANNQVLTANNGLSIVNGILTQNPKQYALFTRNATFQTASNTNIPWTTTITNIGTEIVLTGSNITITPTTGTRTYRIRFNAKYTFNAILAHSANFRLRNPLVIPQIINGVSIPVNDYFGEATSLFSTTYTAQEGANGILEYVITTAVPITIAVAVVGTVNTPTLGSTNSATYPTIEIDSIV